MKKALYALGVLVCVAAIVLCCMQCGAPAHTVTTTSTSPSATNSVSTTTTEVTTTTTATEGGIVLLPTDGAIEDTTDTDTDTTTTTTAQKADETTTKNTTTTTATQKQTITTTKATTTQKPTTTKKTTAATKKTTTTTKNTTTTTKNTTTTTKAPSYENGFPDVDVEITEFETYMLELINVDRVKAGLKPLKMSTYYHDCAEIRVKEASVHWGHERPNGKQWHTVFEEQGKKPYGYNQGENLGDGFTCSKKGVEMIYEALYASPGHRENMMNPQFTEVAIAIYWTKNDDLPTGYSGTVAQLFFGKIDDDTE